MSGGDLPCPTFSQLLSTEQPAFTQEELKLFEKCRVDSHKMNKACDRFLACANLPVNGVHLLDEAGVGRLIDSLGMQAGPFRHQYYQAIARGRPIDFRSALMAMVALDPHTPHNLGDMACNVRLKYMFAFYDKDGDKLLNAAELKEIIAHGRMTRGQEVTPEILEEQLRELEKGINSPAPDTPIPFPTFCKAVYDGKLRGTSSLFRTRFGLDSDMPSAGDAAGASGSGSGSAAASSSSSDDVPAPLHQGSTSAAPPRPAAAAASASSSAGGAKSEDLLSSGALAEIKGRFKPRETEFLAACNIHDDEIQNFYKRFVATAGKGADAFSPDTLVKLLVRLGVADAGDHAENWFRAFDRDHAGKVDLRQAILGFAAADPMCAHNIGAIQCEVRLAYIHAYFDKNDDGVMDRPDIKAFVLMGKKLKNEEATPEALDRATRDLVERLGGRGTLTPEQLQAAVYSGTVRGTSQIFRVRAQPFKAL